MLDLKLRQPASNALTVDVPRMIGSCLAHTRANATMPMKMPRTKKDSDGAVTKAAAELEGNEKSRKAQSPSNRKEPFGDKKALLGRV